ncbi:MAG: GntR family transcriptional regulator [Anaerolineae bacterium]
MSARQISVRDLPIKPADPGNPIPLYHQIETSLREFIQTGLLKPGDILPPEIELSRAFGVGRHTMRMALSRLTDDHLITRKAGRGTIVNPQTGRIQFFLDRSFTRQMEDLGRKAHSRVLQSFAGPIDHTAPAPLQSRLGSRGFFLMRLRYGDNEPIGLQKTTVVMDRCPDIDRYDFNQRSLYDVLLTHYGLVIHEITYTVSATTADDLKAELLQVRQGSALLVVNTCAYLDNHEAIEYTTSYYRADRYEYSTRSVYQPR